MPAETRGDRGAFADYEPARAALVSRAAARTGRDEALTRRSNRRACQVPIRLRGQ